MIEITLDNIDLIELDLPQPIEPIDLQGTAGDLELQAPGDFALELTGAEERTIDLDLMGFPYYGLSAYEVAVKNGFIGTEAEWLASLRGPTGDMNPATDAARIAAEAAAEFARGHATAAAFSEYNANVWSDQAGVHAQSALNHVAEAAVHRDSTGQFAISVAQMLQTAEAHVTSAGEFADAALLFRTQADTSRAEALVYRNQAASSATTATSASATASDNAIMATEARDSADAFAAAALLSQNTASSYADDSRVEAEAARFSQITATASRDEAVIASQASVIYSENAQAWATDAAASATASSAQRLLAETAAGNASTSETNSATSEQNANSHRAAAALSESAAAQSNIAAGNSASAAANSASTASTQATNASNSATAANTSAVNAQSSFTNANNAATNASNSATAAGTSATNAATSATNAGNSATAANSSQIAASSSYTAARGAAASLYPETFINGGEAFTSAVSSGDPQTVTLPTITTISGFGPAAVVNGGGGAIGTRQITPRTVEKIYEIIAEIQCAVLGTGAATTPMIRLYGINADFTYANAISTYFGTAFISAGEIKTITRRFASTALDANTTAWPTAGAGFRAAAGGSGNSGSTLHLRRFSIREITQVVSAENQATAAATQASNAATSATNAGNSATAANSSAVAAASTYNNTVIINGNQHFDNGITGWNNGNGAGNGATNAVFNATYQGRKNVVVAATLGVTIVSDKLYPVNTARKYRINTGLYIGAGAGNSENYIGIRARDANGAVLVSNPGSATYAACVGNIATGISGWFDLKSDTGTPNIPVGALAPITGEGTGTWAIFPVGTKSVELLAYLNYNNNAARPVALDYFELEDITESVAALTQANAAATQASNASTSAGQAGTSATAASTSATNASISAGNASTSASTASTQASNASASAASASSSAAIAVSVGHRALNPNAGFDAYPAPDNNSLPSNWGWWDGPGNQYRYNDPAGGYSIRMDAQAGQMLGVYQLLAAGLTPADSYHVVEFEAELISGTWDGAGVLVDWRNPDASASLNNTYLTAGTLADASGLVSRTKLGRRTWTLLKQTLPNVSRAYLYAMAHWSGHGAISVANSIIFHRVIIRPATSQEVAAGVALPALQASVTTTQTTVATLDANYALARYEVVANTGGGTARLRLVSSTYGTQVLLDADYIKFGDNTTFNNTVDALVTTIGSNSRIVAWGAAFGVDGTLTEWEGPSNITWGNHSRANAYYYRANVAPYAGGSALAPSFTVTQSHMVRVVASFGAGNKTTPTVTLTPVSNAGAMSYTWSNVFGDSSITATSPNGATTAFTGYVNSGQEKQAQFAWQATDAGTGKTITGYCSAAIIGNA